MSFKRDFFKVNYDSSMKYNYMGLIFILVLGTVIYKCS